MSNHSIRLCASPYPRNLSRINAGQNRRPASTHSPSGPAQTQTCKQESRISRSFRFCVSLGWSSSSTPCGQWVGHCQLSTGSQCSSLTCNDPPISDNRTSHSYNSDQRWWLQYHFPDIVASATTKPQGSHGDSDSLPVLWPYISIPINTQCILGQQLGPQPLA